MRPVSRGRTAERHPRESVSVTLGKFQSHLAIALRVVAPAFAHLDEQEEMHRRFGDLGDLLARFGADRLQRLAALPDHDLLLAVALDIDRLLDPDRAILHLLPGFGLDRRLVGQFLMQPVNIFSRVISAASWRSGASEIWSSG